MSGHTRHEKCFVLKVQLVSKLKVSYIFVRCTFRKCPQNSSLVKLISVTSKLPCGPCILSYYNLGKYSEIIQRVNWIIIILKFFLNQNVRIVTQKELSVSRKFCTNKAIIIDWYIELFLQLTKSLGVYILALTHCLRGPYIEKFISFSLISTTIALNNKDLYWNWKRITNESNKSNSEVN